MKKLIALAAIFSAVSVSAMAQDAANTDVIVIAAKNQLGVLEYCQSEGHINGDATVVQNKIIAMLPPATDSAAVDKAYESGKAGNISAMGVEQSLADAGKAQGVEVAALCKQIGDAVAAAGANLPN